jgi:UDPglucose 6-dehydrogenase
MSFKIGVIGCGFVGGAIIESLKMKGLEVGKYDKYKNGGIGSFDEVVINDILFLCLPTPYNDSIHEYDKSAIYTICEQLVNIQYSGLVVIKSTIEIGTMKYLSESLPLKYIHNPEFLTARTATHDFHHQEHIVLGTTCTVRGQDIEFLKAFYEQYYPDTPISICKASESESMKLFCNNFYAVKVQIMNEFYLLCKSLEIDYDRVIELVIKNKWVNPMHTQVPGPDGKLSYGGYCFPKDTNALNELMKKMGTPNAILDATIKERNEMRDDHDNCS